MNNIERMQRIIDDYSQDFEADNKNKWVNEYNNRLSEITEETSQLHELIDEATYAAQRLGFIEGMQFARDVMSNFKNIDSERETVLRDFLENIKSQE